MKYTSLVFFFILNSLLLSQIQSEQLALLTKTGKDNNNRYSINIFDVETTFNIFDVETTLKFKKKLPIAIQPVHALAIFSDKNAPNKLFCVLQQYERCNLHQWIDVIDINTENRISKIHYRNDKAYINNSIQSICVHKNETSKFSVLDGISCDVKIFTIDIPRKENTKQKKEDTYVKNNLNNQCFLPERHDCVALVDSTPTSINPMDIDPDTEKVNHNTYNTWCKNQPTSICIYNFNNKTILSRISPKTPSPQDMKYINPVCHPTLPSIIAMHSGKKLELWNWAKKEHIKTITLPLPVPLEKNLTQNPFYNTKVLFSYKSPQNIAILTRYAPYKIIIQNANTNKMLINYDNKDPLEKIIDMAFIP